MPLPNDDIGSKLRSVATMRLEAEVSRGIATGIASAAEIGSAGAGPLPEPFANGGGFVVPFVGVAAG